MRYKFNTAPSIYWSTEAKISFIQRRIIVASIIYYQLNESVISDKDYDELSKQLVYLKNKYPEAYKKSDYYYAMYDFDGSTGFDLPDRLSRSDYKRVNEIAHIIVRRKQ